MPTPAALEAQLAQETAVKQRHYVLSPTRARWTALGVGVALLAGVRLGRLVPISWWFIVGFAATFSAANYAMHRIARDQPFRSWYVHLNFAIGTALISAVLYALGPTGHVVYAAYLITPLQAALYLRPTDAWPALELNLPGLGLVLAIRASACPGD